jgi:hypothetical protein
MVKKSWRMSINQPIESSRAQLSCFVSVVIIVKYMDRCVLLPELVGNQGAS